MLTMLTHAAGATADAAGAAGAAVAAVVVGAVGQSVSPYISASVRTAKWCFIRVGMVAASCRLFKMKVLMKSSAKAVTAVRAQVSSVRCSGLCNM